MFEIKIDDKAVMSSLDRLAATAHNMSPVMRMISQELALQTEKNFAAEGRPKWLGIKPRKGREGGHILQDTGQLAASISHSHDSLSATVGSNKVYAAIHQLGGVTHHAARSQYAYFKMNKNGEVGNRFVKKGKSNFKQGITIGAHDVTMPARPFLPVDAQGQLQPEASENILGLVNDYLRSVIG